MQVGLRRALYRAGSGVSLAESKRQHTPPSGTGVNLSSSLNVNLMNPFHPFHTLGDDMIGEIFLSQYIVLIDEARRALITAHFGSSPSHRYINPSLLCTFLLP